MQFSQSVDFPLTQKDTCTLSGQLQTQNGTGGGGVNMSWRHLFSHKSWAEMELTAGIKFVRHNQHLALCFYIFGISESNNNI